MLNNELRQNLRKELFEYAVGKYDFNDVVIPKLYDKGVDELTVMCLQSKERISILTDDILFTISSTLDECYHTDLCIRYFDAGSPENISRNGVVFQNAQQLGNVYLATISNLELSIAISDGLIASLLPIDRIKLLNTNIIANRYINGIKLIYRESDKCDFILSNTNKALTVKGVLSIPYDSLITLLNILAVAESNIIQIPVWIVSDSSNALSSYNMIDKIQSFVLNDIANLVQEDLINIYPFAADVILKYLSENYLNYDKGCSEISLLLLKIIYFCKEHNCIHAIPKIKVRHLISAKQGNLDILLKL